MTKADIIEGVYEKVGFSKKESAEIVELVFDTVKETLERGDKIKISGFGNFQVRHKNARVGRNPQTGEEIKISERRVVDQRLAHLEDDGAHVGRLHRHRHHHRQVAEHRRVARQRLRVRLSSLTHRGAAGTSGFPAVRRIAEQFPGRSAAW